MKRLLICIILLGNNVNAHALVSYSRYLPRKNGIPLCTNRLAINTPATFGKTHFIRGYAPALTTQQQDMLQKKTRTHQTSTNYPSAHLDFSKDRVCEVFFSPDDDVHTILISLIDQEQESISIAIYSFTDRDIAKALERAEQRGVSITIVTDFASTHDRYSKIGQLLKSTISISVYNPKAKKHNGARRAAGLMHNKFAVFGKNNGGKSLVWTGSFNFTRAGHLYNQENVIILDDQQIVDKYTQRFETIKKQSHRYRSPVYETG